MDIFSFFSNKLDCFESDLHIDPSLYWNEQVIDEAVRHGFSSSEWNELLSYVFSTDISLSSVSEASKYLSERKCKKTP